MQQKTAPFEKGYKRKSKWKALDSKYQVETVLMDSSSINIHSY